MHKVRSYLHRQIIADSHDVVAASMLSGMPCLSANTPLYYSQYSIKFLRDLYCRSVQQVLIRVYACVGLEAPVYEVPEVMPGAVGARNCLRLETVRLNLSALLKVLRKRPRENVNEVVHWHNCLTLWCVQMYMMATGCRAIRNPLKRLAEFDGVSGCGALGDKGADDGHMSRLVVLPKLLRQQLSAYESHCADIQVFLKTKLSEPVVLRRGFFLRLSDKGYLQCEEIRPRTLSAVMRQVDGYTPHPVNGFRKLVRTELAERGCPPEVLAAYMGHWLSGEEPQDVYSSFCPLSYVASLHGYLMPLMRELGWTVRNSHVLAGGAA
ncbi:MAG: site-specific integrase [Pseudomonadaceae bacterium]|nr:site-specific integrase [Pseudomonadaceae bacterium]